MLRMVLSSQVVRLVYIPFLLMLLRGMLGCESYLGITLQVHHAATGIDGEVEDYAVVS